MSGRALPMQPLPIDRLGRGLRDLRISVTDRCNFRCTYCMPREVFGQEWQFLPQPQLLTFEEITRLVRLFVTLGVRKLRITGGEPLLRRDLVKLIAMLAAVDGVEDIAMTTNGALLAKWAAPLREAGLNRVTVSLDSLDNRVFQSINDVGFPVERVLEGIAAAGAAGFAPLKVNMVVKKGINDQDIVPMARHFRHSGHIVRFIEFMDVGETNGWRMDEVVPAAEILRRLETLAPLHPLPGNYRGEVAARYRYADGSGEVGIISSVTQPFCSSCGRGRMTAEGKLYHCLFANQGLDLKQLLRGGCGDEEISRRIADGWRARTDRYSEIRASGAVVEHKVEMSRMGG